MMALILANADADADANNDTVCKFINVHLLDEQLHLHFHAHKGRERGKSDSSHRTQQTVTFSFRCPTLKRPMIGLAETKN
jgi:hypothetical protein